ncbi:MAG TPA: hypothetical protein VIM97_06850 [Actinomycetes bacterium]|jgi:hypothetical protein
MSLRGMVQRLPVAGAAVAGAALGHTLIYLTAEPDADLRHAILTRTGHGYWSVAVAAAVVLGSLSAVGTVARHLLGGPRHDPGGDAAESLEALARRLAALQVGIYLVQEVVERVVVGASVADLLGPPHLLLTGVAVQALVAVGVAAVLVALGRVAGVVAAALAAAARPPEPEPAGWLAAPAARVLCLPGAPVGSRAPPVASISCRR